ncbi:hypothetical protein TNCV_500201 [Trichonephila clavipes]|nr:hypothetical protein TNCV_500201 [Trichonephila clavipes]
MLVTLPRAPVLSGGLRCKTQLFSGTLYMAASFKTPPHQSKGPQKFKNPLQVPVFPGRSLLCRHSSCEKPSDSTSFHSVLVCHRTSSQVFLGNKNQCFFYYGGKGSGGSKGESKEVKIARERRVRETRTHKRVSPCQKITRVCQDCETRTCLKKTCRYTAIDKEFEKVGIIGMTEAGWLARGVPRQVGRSYLIVRCWDQWAEETSFTRRLDLGHP